MGFKIAARTILHLGAELISSDDVAFYELIKNAFDAHSKRAYIRVVTRIPHDLYKELKATALTKQASRPSLNAIISSAVSSIDPETPDADAIIQKLHQCSSTDQLVDALDDANYIEIRDRGDGMSLSDLQDVYLTIGTRSRYLQRKALFERLRTADDPPDSPTPILGEKGVGRLSAMRLGRKLLVTTTKAGERRFNQLQVDWDLFSHESEAMLEDIDIRPAVGPRKDDPAYFGTTLLISRLNSPWNQGKVERIVRDEFSKLIDPFQAGQSRISVRYNGDRILVPPFNQLLFDHAHADLESTFGIDDDGNPYLAGRIGYRRRHRETHFRIRTEDLISISDVSSIASLRSLGPFKVALYWYNRQILAAIDGIGDQRQVRKLLAQWAGGLMVYRDGFRVNPYGGPEDDWLGLDRKALGSGGYKVNRQQIVGKVDITSRHNPRLLDQTNREGLQECEEKRVLVALLQHLLRVQFKRFLDRVDEEVQAREPVTFNEIEDHIENQEKGIDRGFKLLLRQFPQVSEDTPLLRNIREAIKNIKALLKEANALALSYKEGQNKMIHLAGLGLMVEIIAHEINRATEQALRTLASKSVDSLGQLRTLESQLKTLHKRLRVLDPLDTTARQRKERFDVVQWVAEILDYHEGQFARHGITAQLVKPGKDHKLYVSLVKGMVVQILENLISNSVYWLKQQCKLDASFEPRITVAINAATKELLFSDNGPGIEPGRREEIFQPFVTTKPPGEGKGLGLYIAQEIAKYHNLNLYLSDKRTVHEDVLNTFVLSLEGGMPSGG